MPQKVPAAAVPEGSIRYYRKGSSQKMQYNNIIVRCRFTSVPYQGSQQLESRSVKIRYNTQFLLNKVRIFLVTTPFLNINQGYPH